MKPFDEARVEPLLTLLFDDADDDLAGRDDAAIDLGESDDPRAIEALLRAGGDPHMDDMLRGSAGESLAQIAIRTGVFDPTWMDRLLEPARSELLGWLRADRPDLLR